MLNLNSCEMINIEAGVTTAMHSGTCLKAQQDVDLLAADRGRARDTARSTAAGGSDKAAGGAKKGAKKRKRKQAKARNKRAAGAKYSFADMVLLGVVCVGRSVLPLLSVMYLSCPNTCCEPVWWLHLDR